MICYTKYRIVTLRWISLPLSEQFIFYFDPFSTSWSYLCILQLCLNADFIARVIFMGRWEYLNLFEPEILKNIYNWGGIYKYPVLEKKRLFSNLLHSNTKKRNTFSLKIILNTFFPSIYEFTWENNSISKFSKILFF